MTAPREFAARLLYILAMPTILRWSLWGPRARNMIPMLRDSILSFRRYFGRTAEYVVFTDRPDIFHPDVSPLATIIPYDSVPSCSYNCEGVAPWKKWAPTARWAPGKAEILVDADVFCVGYPAELIEFCETSGDAVCTLQETSPEWWCYGVFRNHLASTISRVNAGLVAQQSGANIQGQLEALYSWWQSSTVEGERTPHDEQGAVAVILREAEKRNRAFLLPLDRYLLLSPRSNSDVKSLDGYAIIHTTYPDHPYYHRFRHVIARPPSYERT